MKYKIYILSFVFIFSFAQINSADLKDVKEIKSEEDENKAIINRIKEIFKVNDETFIKEQLKKIIDFLSINNDYQIDGFIKILLEQVKEYFIKNTDFNFEDITINTVLFEAIVDGLIHLLLTVDKTTFINNLELYFKLLLDSFLNSFQVSAFKNKVSINHINFINSINKLTGSNKTTKELLEEAKNTKDMLDLFFKMNTIATTIIESQNFQAIENNYNTLLDLAETLNTFRQSKKDLFEKIINKRPDYKVWNQLNLDAYDKFKSLKAKTEAKETKESKDTKESKESVDNYPFDAFMIEKTKQLNKGKFPVEILGQNGNIFQIAVYPQIATDCPKIEGIYGNTCGRHSIKNDIFGIAMLDAYDRAKLLDYDDQYIKSFIDNAKSIYDEDQNKPQLTNQEKCIFSEINKILKSIGVTKATLSFGELSVALDAIKDIASKCKVNTIISNEQSTILTRNLREAIINNAFETLFADPEHYDTNLQQLRSLIKQIREFRTNKDYKHGFYMEILDNEIGAHWFKIIVYKGKFIIFESLSNMSGKNKDRTNDQTVNELIRIFKSIDLKRLEEAVQKYSKRI